MRPLDTLNNAIKDVASGKGDLTQRLETDTDQEFSELATNFNTFMENLQQQIIESKSISDQILNGTQITAEGAKDSAGNPVTGTFGSWLMNYLRNPSSGTSSIIPDTTNYQRMTAADGTSLILDPTTNQWLDEQSGLPYSGNTIFNADGQINQ